MVLEKNVKQLFLTLLIVLIASTLAVQYMLITNPAETYSEVYFAHSALPETAEQNSEFPISFIISNHEGETMQYNYKIYFSGTEKANSAVTISPEENKQIEEKIEIENAAKGKKKITVKVEKTTTEENAVPQSPITKNYEIYFWINIV